MKRAREVHQRRHSSVCVFLWLLIVLGHVPKISSAEGCVDLGDYIHWTGGVDTPGAAFDVVVVDNYAYVADGGHGLQVLDVSNPGAPVIVGGFDLPQLFDVALNVAVADSFAYLVGLRMGFRVIDVSDPTRPTPVKFLDTSSGYSVKIEGSYAYVARPSDVLVIDVSNPGDAFIVGSLDLPGTTYDLCVDGHYAYVANSTGFRVVEVSNPAAPWVVGMNTTSGNLALLVGEYVYIGGGPIKVMDVTDPSRPLLVGTVDMPADVDHFVAVGDYVYVGHKYGLHVLDVTNPVSPFPIGSATMPYDAGGVDVSGGHAYVACVDAGIQVVDVLNPRSPTAVGGFSTVGFPTAIAVVDNLAYIAQSLSKGMMVVDVTDPRAPVPIGGIAIERGQLEDVTVSGHYAYVASKSLGLNVIDVTDPSSMTIVGSVDTPHEARAVAIAGRHAYVADSDSGLQVIDVSRPQEPRIVGSAGTLGSAQDVAVKGQYAYVADKYSGLYIFDIRRPSCPVVVGNLYIPGWALNVAVRGNYAYVAAFTGPYRNTWNAGLIVVDIEFPDNPRVVGSEFLADVTDVSVAGNYAYVCSYSGLLVVDITAPDAPRLLGKYGSRTQVRGLTVAGEYVYAVYDWASSVFPRHCSDAEVNPMLDIKPWSCPNKVSIAPDVRQAHPKLQAALLGTDGVDVRDIDRKSLRLQGVRPSFVSRPRHLGTPRVLDCDCERNHETWDDFQDLWMMFPLDEVLKVVGPVSPGDSRTLTLTGTTKDGAEFQAGDCVIFVGKKKVDDRPNIMTRPTATTLENAVPNPFNPLTTIRFSLSEAARARLVVYDVSGRRVATLVDGELSVGEHSVIWNARGIASGVYFYRLTAGSFSETRRMILLK